MSLNPILNRCLIFALVLPVGMTWAQEAATPPAAPAKAAVQSSQQDKKTPSHAGTPALVVSHEELEQAVKELSKENLPAIMANVAKPPDHDIPLPPTGIAAMQAANKYIYGENTPTVDSDGWVTYVYGHGIPVVVASPLHLATVRLEKGELILADSAELVGDPDIRVLPRTFGSGADQQTFVLIKPKNAGVSSDIVFGTNRRLYTIRVLVKPFDYTPRVAFVYPDDDQKKAWKEYQQKQELDQERERRAQSEKNARELLARLDTSRDVKNTVYAVKVKRHADYLKPTAIWDDGIRTHIQLPADAATHDLPIPKTYSPKGLDSPNYRYDGTKLIVDAIFMRCELISGVGQHQQKILITNKNKPTPEVQDAQAAQ
jgi:P-type conjugative transfer protein TrbG